MRRDYFKERFTVEELRAVLADAGLTPQEVLSRRAKAYATLVGDRDLSDDELLALMIQEPTLLRRPLAVRGTQTAIGFDRVGLTALALVLGRPLERLTDRLFKRKLKVPPDHTV